MNSLNVMHKRTHNAGGGYVMLLSIVIAGVMLVIALSTLNIVRKEVILSTSARESQFAFYAADAGAECALYWDRNPEGWYGSTAFATSVQSRTTTNDGTVGVSADNVLCAGNNINPDGNTTGKTGISATTEFGLAFPDGACSSTTILKQSGGRGTVIESRGWNTCNPANPRRIERAIRVKY